MQHHRPSLTRVLGPALLLAAGLALSGRGAYAADYDAHVDGTLTTDGGCLMLRLHDGRAAALVGDSRGLLAGDHVRLEGRFAPDPGCGAAGFEVARVQVIWGDENHRTARYDQRGGEPFLHFAERTGRLDESRRYENERRGYEGDSRADERSDPSYRDERYEQHPERPDRNGRYVYQGPHRRVTLVGRLHEADGACPTLETEHAVFALDGSLRDYQAGDRVRVSGVLYDGDPNGPCGGPTVVITGIRGR